MTEETTSKDWVTIKIPVETRNKARQDNRTYEEIMQAGLGESPSDELERLVERLDEFEDRLPEEIAKELQKL